MNPLDFPLFADENIDPEVVEVLRHRGHDILTTVEAGLGGATDRTILRRARESRRVILTHDADFGTLAIRDGELVFGVVHLRPGDLSASVVVTLLTSIAAVVADIEPPFVVVGDHRGAELRVRVRRIE